MLNCDEVHNLTGDVLDRNLSGEKKAELMAHLKACPPCRTDYELELLAKSVIKKTLPYLVTPATVTQNILRQITAQPEGAPNISWLRRLLSWRVLAPALATGVAVALLILFVLPPASPPDVFSHSAANDIINQSLKNFSLVQAGDLKPAAIFQVPGVLAGYFRDHNVDFAVNVPVDDSCASFGAIVNSFAGVNLAHVMYRRGNDLVYVYEVRKNEGMEGTVLSLPPAARESLATTGWYTDPQHKNCNVVLWTVNETLCAAVSTMNKDRLFAFLTQ